MRPISTALLAMATVMALGCTKSSLHDAVLKQDTPAVVTFEQTLDPAHPYYASLNGGRCLAFALESDGRVITAGHCVQGISVGTNVPTSRGLACLVAADDSGDIDIALLEGPTLGLKPFGLPSAGLTAGQSLFFPKTFNGTLVGGEARVDTVAAWSIEASPVSATTASCPGDSGGPAVVKGLEVAGIVVGDCGGTSTCGSCSRFTRVFGPSAKAWLAKADQLRPTVCPKSGP